MNFVTKFSFLGVIFFTPMCLSQDYLVDEFITQTGFMLDCKKTMNGGWHHYDCPRESGLGKLITMAEADWSYSENINLQTLIDSDGKYNHNNFVVNDWEVFLSKKADSNHALMSFCSPFRCLRIIGDYNNLFNKIISLLKKTHNKSLKQDK